MSAPAGHHDDVAGYALGRLDPAERARFEAHLETCEACRAELDDLREVAGLLPLASPAAAPPPNLEARVLAAVRREATPAPGREAAAAARPSLRRLPAWAPRLGVAALAAAALAGAFLLGGRVLDGGVDGTREITAVLQQPGGGGARPRWR